MLRKLYVKVLRATDLISELIFLRIVGQEFYDWVLLFLEEPSRVLALVKVVLREHIDFVPTHLICRSFRQSGLRSSLIQNVSLVLIRLHRDIVQILAHRQLSRRSLHGFKGRRIGDPRLEAGGVLGVRLHAVD